MVNIKKSVQSKHFGHPVNFKNYSLTLGVRKHRRLHPRYSSSLQNLKYKTIFINKLILKLKRNLFNVFNTTAAKFSYSKEGVPRIMTVARRLESRLRTLNLFETSEQDPDPLDPPDLGFLDPDPQKCADPRIQVQGVKYQPKTAEKNFFTPKTKICTFEKKRDYTNFPISEWFIKVWDKNMRKKNKKFENYFLFKRFSKSDMTWILIQFFPVRIQDPQPHQNKWILSTVCDIQSSTYFNIYDSSLSWHFTFIE